MLLEDMLVNAKDWFERKKRNPNIKLVCAAHYYPAYLGKNKFDLIARSLSPPKVMLKVFKETLKRNLAIAKQMRSWGETEIDRIRRASFNAFVKAFGVDAVYYRRYLNRSNNAQEALRQIRSWLTKGYIVVLFTDNEEVASYRFILMQILLKARSLHSMFKEHNYPREYLDFAYHVQNKFKWKMRTI